METPLFAVYPHNHAVHKAESAIFQVFGMTRPAIEPSLLILARSPTHCNTYQVCRRLCKNADKRCKECEMDFLSCKGCAVNSELRTAAGLKHG